MKKNATRYTPRPGSKVAEAINVLSNGPMTPKELAQALQRESSAINTLLLRALTHEAIAKVKDKRGRLYFALPDAILDDQFIAAHATTPVMPDTDTPVPANILPLQIAASSRAPSLISSNVHAINSHEHEKYPIAHDENLIAVPLAGNATSHPVIAGLFSDGELTISIGGECLQLDTAQRQQLYAYLHKIRYLE